MTLKNLDTFVLEYKRNVGQDSIRQQCQVICETESYTIQVLYLPQLAMVSDNHCVI